MGTHNEKVGDGPHPRRPDDDGHDEAVAHQAHDEDDHIYVTHMDRVISMAGHSMKGSITIQAMQ